MNGANLAGITRVHRGLGSSGCLRRRHWAAGRAVAGAGLTAVCWNAALEVVSGGSGFMVIHRHPAAAAQVSVCAVMTVILRKEPSCNCARQGHLASVLLHSQNLAFVSAAVTLPFIPQAAPSNHRNRSLTCCRYKTQFIFPADCKS